MDLAWPACRYPFGSGGKRMAMRLRLPLAMPASIIVRMRLDAADCGALLIEDKLGLYQSAVCAENFTRNQARPGTDINCEKVTFIW